MRLVPTQQGDWISGNLGNTIYTFTSFGDIVFLQQWIIRDGQEFRIFSKKGGLKANLTPAANFDQTCTEIAREWQKKLEPGDDSKVSCDCGTCVVHTNEAPPGGD